ncbi:MAG: cupin domain-containing protein [Sphingomicrobium sp.]
MKTLLLAIGGSLIAISGSFASAQNAPGAHTIVTPAQIKWGAAPPSLPPGAQAAVLYGDPAKEGVFILRLRLPKGYKIPPHTHPRPEIVTVISGALHVGMGTKAIPGQAKRLPPGSFFAFDPGMAHYAGVQEQTVVQLSTTGPWMISYVNEADDPRKKK